MTKLVFIVAQPYRDEELTHTRAALGVDFTSEVASTTIEMVHGADTDTVIPNLLIDDILAEDYDGIVIVGGGGMYEVLYNKPDVTAKIIEKVNAFNTAGKLVAAICIGPIALAKAGIITGKKITAWNGEGTQQTEIETAGAIFTGEDVTIDGNIITADGPLSATKFGGVIVEYFAPPTEQ